MVRVIGDLVVLITVRPSCGAKCFRAGVMQAYAFTRIPIHPADALLSADQCVHLLPDHTVPTSQWAASHIP
jgi:hypothetical protein